MTYLLHSRDAALVALGFTRCDDGTLRAPDGAVVTPAPIEKDFFELRILVGGAAVTAVLAVAAIKVVRP